MNKVQISKRRFLEHYAAIRARGVDGPQAWTETIAASMEDYLLWLRETGATQEEIEQTIASVQERQKKNAEREKALAKFRSN